MSYSSEVDRIIMRILNAQNYYEVLILHHGATDEELKSSYKKLIAKVHPDKSKHPKATEATAALNVAYATLQKKRQQYDAYLRSPTNVDTSSFYMSNDDVTMVLLATGVGVVVVAGLAMLFDWLTSRDQEDQEDEQERDREDQEDEQERDRGNSSRRRS